MAEALLKIVDHRLKEPFLHSTFLKMNQSMTLYSLLIMVYTLKNKLKSMVDSVSIKKMTDSVSNPSSATLHLNTEESKLEFSFKPAAPTIPENKP